MDVTKANAALADIKDAGLLYGAKRSEISFTKILCAEGDFVAGELASGKFAAMWKASIVVCDDAASLKEFLNQHERILFDNSIIK